MLEGLQIFGMFIAGCLLLGLMIWLATFDWMQPQIRPRRHLKRKGFPKANGATARVLSRSIQTMPDWLVIKETIE